MASRADLVTDVADWLNRQDFGTRSDAWIRMCEVDIGELLRARCMITRATQAIDAPSVTLPANFLEMESMRDADTRQLLSLEDHWTGPLCTTGPVTAWRLVGGCVEWLPPPQLDGATTTQTVEMAWYAQPPALLDPQDSNAVLEQHYQVYLFGTCRYAAKWARDADVAQQAEADLTEAIAAANAWKVKSDYSGAPLRAVVRSFG